MRRSVFGRRNALIHKGWSRAGLALVAVVLVALGMRLFAPGALAHLLSPLAAAGAAAAATVASLGSVFTGPAALQSSLEEARQEARVLSERNVVLAARVADLERLVGTRIEPRPGILAGVVARPPQSPYDTLLIDQGSDAGVAVGAQVSGEGGIPVGTVASVSAGSARVLLYSSPETVTEAWVGEARTPLTLTGTGAGTYSARAPREAVIAADAQVFVPGPGSLPLARVVRIDSNPADPSVTVFLQSLSNPFSLAWVSVAPLAALP